MAVVYHWKHGWIPLDHTAAMKKAKGNHELADKMLSDAPHANGIQSRQDVAKAVRDLPNVPESHRSHALTNVREAAAKHDSLDLVPGSGHRGSVTRSRGDSEHQFQMQNEKGRAAVKRPADHTDFSKMSDADLDAAIARVEKAGGMAHILSGLRREKAARARKR